jgi:ribosomal protein S1
VVGRGPRRRHRQAGRRGRGYLKASDIRRERVEDARNEFKVGDTVEAKIVSVDRKNRT